MSDAYIIEIGDEAVGLAARDKHGFRFHAALHAFNSLDGKLFATLDAANRAARALRSPVGRRDAAAGRRQPFF